MLTGVLNEFAQFGADVLVTEKLKNSRLELLFLEAAETVDEGFLRDVRVVVDGGAGFLNFVQERSSCVFIPHLYSTKECCDLVSMKFEGGTKRELTAGKFEVDGIAVELLRLALVEILLVLQEGNLELIVETCSDAEARKTHEVEGEDLFPAQDCTLGPCNLCCALIFGVLTKCLDI